MTPAIGIALAGLIAAGSLTIAGVANQASAKARAVEFKSATLIVETNGPKVTPVSRSTSITNRGSRSASPGQTGKRSSTSGTAAC